MKVAVVGLGKLGLPLAALLAASGNEVHGFDLSSSQRDLIKSGEFNFKEPRLNELLLKSRESFVVSDSISEAIKDVALVFVIVPTPSMPSGEFTNEFVMDALNEIGRANAGSNKKIVIIYAAQCRNRNAGIGTLDGFLKITRNINLVIRSTYDTA